MVNSLCWTDIVVHLQQVLVSVMCVACCGVTCCYGVSGMFASMHHFVQLCVVINRNDCVSVGVSVIYGCGAFEFLCV